MLLYNILFTTISGTATATGVEVIVTIKKPGFVSQPSARTLLINDAIHVSKYITAF
jgi:hypothetical protein